eukprot:366052-Chlamydomonas_euryale.AAC.36
MQRAWGRRGAADRPSCRWGAPRAHRRVAAPAGCQLGPRRWPCVWRRDLGDVSRGWHGCPCVRGSEEVAAACLVSTALRIGDLLVWGSEREELSSNIWGVCA